MGEIPLDKQIQSNKKYNQDSVRSLMSVTLLQFIVVSKSTLQ